MIWLRLAAFVLVASGVGYILAGLSPIAAREPLIVGLSCAVLIAAADSLCG